MASNTPITSVTPVDFDGNSTGSTLYNIPIPSAYLYTLTDISAPNAGRASSMKMNKMRKGQAIRLDIEWSYPSITDCSYILKAFNSEYVSVRYLDAKEGSYLTKVFYVGDRATPLWNSSKGRWENLKFGIIQQVPDAG